MVITLDLVLKMRTADLITRLGDVVRIAPNEVVFFSAQALSGKLAQFPVC